MENSSLTKYAPESLDAICGQEHIVSFFKGVVARPEQAPRAYGFFGTYGVGKTLTARCLAKCLGEKSSVQYLEYDSGDPNIRENFESVLDTLFQLSEGYKVVVLDEFHLVSEQTQQMLLKPLEELTGDTFVIIISTNPEKIMKTIHSRILPFYFSSIGDANLIEYGKRVLHNRGVEVSEEVLNVCIQNSYGHVRDFLHQLDIVMFSGEDYFLQHYRDLKTLWESFFKGIPVVDKLLVYPVVRLRTSLAYFIQDDIARDKKVLVSRASALKAFHFYLKMITYIKTDQDFVSFLFFFQDFLKELK